MKRVTFWRGFRNPECVVCDDFTFDLHEMSGKFTLKFYDMHSAEKRLTGAVAEVHRLEVERLP